jgi:hypothetical protein
MKLSPTFLLMSCLLLRVLQVSERIFPAHPTIPENPGLDLLDGTPTFLLTGLQADNAGADASE